MEQIGNKKKKILCAVPMPPPATGLSIISESVAVILSKMYKVSIINLSKNDFIQGKLYFSRLKQIVNIFKKLTFLSKKVETVYLTLAQSLLGNLRDLLIVWLCRKNTIIVHLHGGGIKKKVYNKYRYILLLNKFVFSYVDKCIVLSKSLKKQYSFLPSHKICTVSNFAEHCFFLNPETIRLKFLNAKNLNIIYLSNMIEEKGYKVLLKAVKLLSRDLQNKINLVFIGKFDTEEAKQSFLSSINAYKNISYLWHIDGNARASYMMQSHIFCLPSFHRWGEGQPLSILEAYASGCCVVTTKIGGIPDIFKEGSNGFYVKQNSVKDLERILKKIVNMKRKDLMRIAQYNYKYAKENFRRDIFKKNMLDCFHSVMSNEEVNN